MSQDPSRRDVVALGAACMATLAAGCGGNEIVGSDDPTVTSDCTPGGFADTATAADIEGPFYLPDAPLRSDLDLLGETGVPLVLEGSVTDENGDVPGDLSNDVWVEIWHAGPAGGYDNDTSTMNYRGRVQLDGDGEYRFTTLLPGRYLNGSTLRPIHIHMKVWVGDTEALTTQIYFTDDPYLDSDAWAEPARTVCLEQIDPGDVGGDDATARVARFDVVVA